MSAQEKNLKLSCIACLFIGLFAIIAGAIAAASAVDADAIATIAGGVVGLPLGVQTSRLANVPSNAKKIRLMALLFTLCASALVGIAFALGNPTPLQMAALVLTAVIGVAMLAFSHTLVKAQERV